MNELMRAVRGACAFLGVAGVACINTAEPTGFVYQYQIGVYACDSASGCAAPDSGTAVAAAAPGDTIWLRHDITLIQAAKSTAVATIRPDCAENAAVLFGGATVQRVPEAITCADSTVEHTFTFQAPALTRFTQWVVDSTLTPSSLYAVTGRVMVQPRIEPSLGFVIE